MPAPWVSPIVNSRYETEVRAPMRKEAPAPAGAVLLRWKLDAPVEHRYALEQRMVDALRAEQSPVEARALLVVSGQGNGRAEVTMEGITAVVAGRTTRAPPGAIAVTAEDGFIPELTSQPALAQLLFPLPRRPLRVGEAEIVPVRVPTTAGGAVSFTEGKQRMVLRRLVVEGGRTLAELHSELSIDAGGPMAFAVRGKAVHTFDVDGHAFVDGVGAFVLEAGHAQPGPPGAPRQPHEGDAIRVRNDNLVRFQRTTAPRPDGGG